MQPQMNTKAIPSINSLLTKIPSGREIHNISEYQLPSLDGNLLDSMRAPPDVDDDFTHDMSSDDDIKSPPVPPVGAFPGAGGDIGRSSTAASSNTYF